MLIAFDIGGSRIRAARVARTAGEAQVTLLGEAPTPLDDFQQFVATLAGFVPPDAREVAIRGVAISIAGVVDPASGRLKVANIPCVDGRPVAAELRAALGLPVRVLNDADCFALAEARHGAGRGHRSVFGIILGTGVGGGLVIDRRVIEGAGGFAGEWGHGPVLKTHAAGRVVAALPCGCGQVGCVDTYGGARGLERLHRQLCGTEAGSEQILADWQAGEELAGETMAVWLDLISGPLAMVLNVVGASVVPVGGGLSNVPALINALDHAVRARVLRPTDAALLRRAECLGEPGLIGAAEGFDG